MRIIIDAFGGDNAPDEIIKGCRLAADELHVQIVLTGDEDHPGYVKLDKMAVYRTIVDYPEQPAAEIRKAASKKHLFILLKESSFLLFSLRP